MNLCCVKLPAYVAPCIISVASDISPSSITYLPNDRPIQARPRWSATYTTVQLY